ncbi:MAG: tRNA (adenosine(37)-N6)-dimethylallyltransferase MiaA, partial [Bacteroidales bacterium]|nr:tRNA (adenosine(37)-N6)-dimethylallyltransferase MiaA [Bacteroidales bacterium]
MLLPIIIGPTASQKTRLAALVAHQLGGEIISADSRQVYRGMTIGTGKDLDDYIVNGQPIPYHLIDIR